MQDLFENAKRAAGNAVERAAWEADKLRRATARHREVELLQRERTALVEQLAGVLLDLDQRGQLPDGPLKTLAERLRALDAEANHGHAEVQAIRAEQYVPGSVSISVQRRDDQHRDDQHRDSTQDDPRDGTMSCPTCGRPVRRSAAYCPGCGARLR